MRHRVSVLLAAATLAAMVAPAMAHHALQAEFDTSKRGQFVGTLTRFALVNPHVRWFFDVKNPDGTVTKWEVTAGGPQVFRQNGMTRVFTAGDTYTVTYAPARNGKPLGRIVDIKFPDGRLFTLFHEDPNNPNDQ